MNKYDVRMRVTNKLRQKVAVTFFLSEILG